ncbi:MAG: YncE family protein [Vicinamibacterales bacterium]|nr:YncE family protein [Vicinamibacterales bacterium]
MRLAFLGFLLVQIAVIPMAAQPEPPHLFVAAPSDDADPDRAIRILVFDIGDAHRFVRRLVLWPAAGRPDGEIVRGIAASANTGRFYLSTTRRLAAVDPHTGAIFWEMSYEDHCCERFAVSPDGRTIYAPAFGSPKWYVINAATGELRATVGVAGWPRETLYAPDGRRVYLAAWESETLLVSDAATHEVITTVGPFSGFVCPVTLNAKGTLVFANVDGVVGFEVADLQTGLVLDSVAVDDVAKDAAAEYECPSHGIAFTRNGQELWIADGVKNRLRVFDATVYPPVATAAIDLPAQPRWITFSLDGRYAYASTGDVVDVTTKKIVGALEDEAGAKVSSQHLLELDFTEATRKP